LGAFIVSIFVFLRQRSFENENYFFNYKLEQYNHIVHKTADILHWCFQTIEELTDSEHFSDEAYISIDGGLRNLQLILQKHSPFFPKEITERLDDFYYQFYQSKDDLINKDLIKVRKHLDIYNDKLEVIVNLMRKDLGIEGLDRRLKNRTS
jgi:hypothetical protein